MTSVKFATIAVLLLLAAAVATCSKNCQGKPSAYPVNTAPPVFVKSVTNGKRYLAGQGNDSFHIVHVYGTPTEMGTAYGQLFAAEIPLQIQLFDEYVADMITGALPWFPSWLADLVVKYGGGFLLEFTYNLTAPFTPTRYIEELDAISAAVGIDKWKLRCISQFPEAIKAACTIVGANNQATSNTSNKGGIAHLRGLDFGAHPKIKDYPMVAVYHPTDGTPAIANFGWLGLTGVLTGMSSQTIGLGEKVWDGSSIYNGSLSGEAWTFVTRDVLRATNMAEALAIIKNANRTCGIHLGVGDSTTNTFNGLEINAKQVKIFNWTSIPPYPEHPVIQDVFYWDKYGQPTSSYCLSDLLKENYGNIDAEVLTTQIAAQLQTGDIHCAAFDYTTKVAYFANARKTFDPNGPLDAYDRQFTRLDMAALFNEPSP